MKILGTGRKHIRIMPFPAPLSTLVKFQRDATEVLTGNVKINSTPTAKVLKVHVKLTVHTVQKLHTEDFTGFPLICSK